MRRKVMLLLGICCALLLVGCQKEKGTTEDNPANHGAHAILETKDGYYYNMGYNVYRHEGTEYKDVMLNILCARYHDKESGKVIVLCNKPECEHRGDDNCAATYKGIAVINSVLYENQLYIYGLEEEGTLLSLNLYRAALDGSSMDKIGTVFEAVNAAGKEYRYKIDESVTENYYFIIHKGYAYIPYYVHIGQTSSGFQGGGLVQMNLQTGKTKALYEMAERTEAYPWKLCGCGDYVYMEFTGDNSFRNNGTQRYVISEDRIEKLPSNKDLDYSGFYDVFTTEKYFQLQGIYDSETETVSEYYIGVWDAVSGEALEEQRFSTDLTEKEMKQFFRVMIYGDMIVFATQERVVFYSIKEDTWGEKLGEIKYEHKAPDLSMTLPYLEYKIANGKLYRISEGERIFDPYAGYYADFQLYEVFGCPIEDIVNGKGEWEKVFFYEMVETAATE